MVTSSKKKVTEAVPNTFLFIIDAAESKTSGDSEGSSANTTYKTIPPDGNEESEVDGELPENTASVTAVINGTIEHTTSIQRLFSAHSHPVTQATTLSTTVHTDGSSSATAGTATLASDVTTSISSTYSLRIHRTRPGVETYHYYDGYTDSTDTHPSQFQRRTSGVETTYYHDTKTHLPDGTTTLVEDIGRSTSPTYLSQIKTFTEPHNALGVTSAIVPENTDFTSTYSSELQRRSSRVGTSYYYGRKTHFSPSTSTVTEDIGRSTATTHETQIRTSTKPYNAPEETLATVSNSAAANGSSSAPRTEDNDSGYTASEVTSAPATSYTRGRTKALFSSAKTIEEESGSAKVTYAPRTQQRTSPKLASTAPFTATSSTHFLGTQPITSAQPHTTLEITSVTALSHSGRSINVLSGVTTAEKDVDSTSTHSQKTQSSAVENGSFTASNKNTALPSSTSSGRATEEKGISAKFTHDPRTQQGTSSKMTSSTPFTYPERSARTYLDKSTWDVEDLSSATSSMHFLRTQSRISTLPFITPELTSVTVPSYSGGSTSVLPSTTTAGNDDDSTSTHSLKIQSPAGEYGGFTVSNKNTGLLSSSRRKSSEAPVSSTENMKDNWRTPSSTTHTLTTLKVASTLLHTYKELPSKMDLNTHKTVTGESSSSNSYATEFEYPTSFFSIYSKRTTLPHSNPKDAPATHSSSSHTSNRGVATTTISGAVRSTTSSTHTPEIQRTAESPNTKERTLLTTSPLFAETARGTSSKSDFSATPFSFMTSQGTIQSTKSSESSSSASISTTFTSTIPENTKLIHHSSAHDQVHENISDEETTTRVTGVLTTKNTVTPLTTLSLMTSANKKQVDELSLNTSATSSTVETSQMGRNTRKRRQHRTV
ncbi:hypothetical protein RB195_016040 [Necator americanus]|uniref:Uncharacterized protein n=1 Tax=Necator americanus TaxID=51031 RepID=A0ABR1E7A0_NECAM